MKYATSCYTWKDALISRRMTIDDSIKKSAEMGFDGYEITNLTDDWMDVPFELSSMRRAADMAGIEIPSWCMAADWERGIRREAEKAKNEMLMAEELGVTSGGVSQMVDSLVKSDMVCRTASKDDRRVVYLSISESAKKRLDVLSKFLHDRVAKAMATIPEQDRVVMARSLRTLLKAFYEDAN